MGASGWNYFVPYQEDVSNAFRELREQVFRSGEYVKPFLSLDARYAIIDIEPASIEEAVSKRGDSGTHSILDIARVSPTPDFQAVYPLSSERLREVFGTDRPTRRMVADMIEDDELEELNPRWEGLYIVVYKDDRPDEICFVGSSGD